MKTKYLLFIFSGFVIYLSACKKGNEVDPSSIMGKWNVISDSTFTGVGSNNHAVAYAGRPGDYFDFRTGGTLYTREGMVLDTLSYKLVADTGLIITAFGLNANGVPEISRIENFTAHSLVIAAPDVFTPGGIFGRKTSLSR